MRPDIAKAAESFIGTPFRHQGRKPGAGLDCVGVWVCALQACGVEVEDVTTYRRLPDSRELLMHLRRQFRERSWPEVGDAVVMYAPRHREPRHLGIYVGSGFVVDVVQDKRVRRRTLMPSEVRCAFSVKDGAA